MTRLSPSTRRRLIRLAASIVSGRITLRDGLRMADRIAARRAVAK